MNHLGDTNKMVDTPRTDAEYERLFEIYRNWERKNEPLCCSFENDMRLCRQLERELNESNQRIKRMEALGKELRECASWVGHSCCQYVDQIRRAKAAIEAWYKEAKL